MVRVAALRVINIGHSFVSHAEYPVIVSLAPLLPLQQVHLAAGVGIPFVLFGLSNNPIGLLVWFGIITFLLFCQLLIGPERAV